MSAERNFKGVWIPSDIWLARDLSLAEKVMLVEIDSLQHDTRGCYASNAHFAEFFDLSKSRVSEIISSLTKKGVLEVKQIRQGRQVVERQLRVIHRELPPPSEKAANPLRKSRRTPSENAENPVGKHVEPPSENAEGSNTDLSNTNNNTGEGNTPEAGATDVGVGGLVPAGKKAKPPMIIEGTKGQRFEIPADLKYPGPDTKCHKTWIGYAIRYKAVYGAWPKWNATIAGMLSKFIDRVGADAAPAVAWFYVGVKEAFVTKNMHSIKHLLSGAETYHTQWQTGRTVTTAEAVKVDQTQTNLNTAQSLEDKIRARHEARAQKS